MLKIGDWFGDCYVIDEIASGGMASICLAYDRKRFRLVAIKSLFSQYATDEVFQKRLRREGDIYRQLRHPNIIELLDACHEGDNPHLMLEYIHGETLAGLIKRSPEGCRLELAMRVLEDLVGSLLQAHACSIIHRDLQPANILIDGCGVVKLFDFGIAHAEDDLLRTVTGTIMGTVLYSSPEQSEGKEVDERSDLYSLGLVFYEMVTGRKAVEGKDLGEVLEKKLVGAIEPPSTHRKDLPAPLDEMTLQLLQKEPEKRHRSIGALLDAIIDLRCGLEGKALEDLFGTERERTLYEAKKCFNVGRLPEAKAKAQSFAESGGERDARNPSLLYLLARIHRAAGEAAAAADYYERLMALKGVHDEHVFDYATFLHSQGKLDLALAALAKAAERRPLGEAGGGLKAALESLRAAPKASAPVDSDEPGAMLDGPGKPSPAPAPAPASPASPAPAPSPPAPEQAATSGTEDKGSGWKGAIRSWLSKAMNKSDS